MPRGLVSLRELGWVFAAGACIQLLLALWWSPGLVLILLITWAYLAAMSFEFGVRDWLKKRPITYLWTHMLIMPLVDFYATSSDWLPSGASPDPRLSFFLIASFFNGIVIEIGRKIRVAEQEEKGVETYSKLWGIEKASRVWLVILLVTGVFATLAAASLNAALPVGLLLGSIILGTGFFLKKFLKEKKPKQAKAVETLAGVWTIILYLSLGIIPGLVN